MSTPTLTAGKNPITSHNQQWEAHLHGCKWLAALVASGEHLSSSLFLCAEAQHLRELLIVLMLQELSLHIWGYLLLHRGIRSATVRTCYWQCGFGISTICNNVNCTENIIVLIIIFLQNYFRKILLQLNCLDLHSDLKDPGDVSSLIQKAPSVLKGIQEVRSPVVSEAKILLDLDDGGQPQLSSRTSTGTIKETSLLWYRSSSPNYSVDSGSWIIL